MDFSLLTTKLHIPPQARQIVHRARLVDDLERLLPSYKLVLISAPAGYGKTTLLSQWARASHFPVVWLSIGEEDNDVERFLRSLAASWEAVQPDVGEGPLGLLVSGMAPDRDAVLSAFLTTASGAPDHTVFVLDDYHAIDDLSVHDALTFLLDHLPPTIHFMLAGRSEPPVPLARYRARQELLEIRADDLQFGVDETGAFLNGLMGLELDQNDVVALHTRLEGWIAGLQLVALSLRRHREAVDSLTVSGRHRFIADYLSQEVLARLPDDLRRFLLRSSILDRLSGPLCDTVLEQRGSQETLELLERENLYLVPLDDDRQWFRYHRLFAGFLSEELARRLPDEIAVLHRRAARWHLANDLPDQALRHAVAGNDPELAGRVFERYVNIKLNCGELNDLARWLDSLPPEWTAAYPALDLARAGLLMFTGAFDACMSCLDDVEGRLALVEAEERRWQQAMATAVRCAIACFQNDLKKAETFAALALRDLREESNSFRAMIYHALGDTYRRNGRWADAKVCYLKVPIVIPASEYRVQAAVQAVHVFGALADLELEQGHLRDAGQYWRNAQSALRQPESWGRVELPVSGWVFIRTGELLYEWNDLAGARDHLMRGLERAELGGDVRTTIAGCVNTARLNLTEGDLDAATEMLERARLLLEQAPFPDWSSRYERIRIELWLAQGQRRVAIDWADALLQDGALPDGPDGEPARLALARILIVKGDVASRERALAVLTRLLRTVEEEGRAGIRIEALALQAMAHAANADQSGALTSLELALRLAEPQGYVRRFADLGLPMARLLQEARTRGVLPDYVALLLAACGTGLAAAAGGDATVPEPLSPREQDVLGLLAAGLTNREIAGRLFVSPETVKKHTASIYSKLGARHRAEAAAKARALGLLD